MWLEPKEMSEWAYNYCMNIKDSPEIRKNITENNYNLEYKKDLNNKISK